ncbi:MAG TPA: hypothetical protein VFB65_13135 [Pyrinomonadaceae bacterium]|nr:hypothetical protein [Pyrinomonadaceae bacterium]
MRSNTVTGRIAARDLGDSRLTDHYYAFTGTPGDLLITVQSTNLNGDIDVFTAVTLRPLLKLSLYAESTAPVTKGIYLRKREDLIVRIEARSPNDEEGSYRLYFGGSFEPVAGGPDIAEAETTTEPEKPAVTGKGTRRVNSVGARIAEPEPPPKEVAAATPEPTPAATPEVKPVETPKAVTTEKRTEPETARTTPRNTRGRSRPASPPPTSRRQPAARTKEPAPPPVEEPKAAPAPEPEAEVGPRLIIETNDGTLINRSMSGIRRVTIENGQVVVTGKDGKINRILLANVVRMQIAP